MTTDTGAPPAATLLQFLTAKWIVPALGVVARLGVADELADDPRTAEDLAAACGADPSALRRVLRALASVGVFASDPAGRYALTPVSALLRSGDGSMRNAVIMASMAPMWTPYAHIMHSVRTGRPAFPEVYGVPAFEYLRTHPEEAQIFAEAAAGFYVTSTPPVVAGYDYGRFGTLVDVGGGDGTLLAALLTAYPALRGTLFEMAPMLEPARKVFDAAGVADRASLVAGDFFESVPAGADAYLTKSCLHAFDDAGAVRMLEVLRAAMKRGAVLLAVESVLPGGDEPHYGKLSDIELLTLAGGEERDAAAWARIFAAGGFRILRTLPAGPVTSIIEAVPA
jgi:O-methyltransferase